MTKHQTFGTDGMRGPYGQGLITEHGFERLGHALGLTLVLSQKGSATVVLGRDTRSSGPALQAALAKGLTKAGVNVLDAGMLPTAAVALLVQRHRACAGAVITASHNPANENGVKFFNHEGLKLPSELQERVLAWLNTFDCPRAERRGSVKLLDTATHDYQSALFEHFPALNLHGMRIVLDGAHGAASLVAPAVLRALGAEVLTMACAMQGNTINDKCGAQHPQALQNYVVSCRADIGFAFDGDADRLVAVDHRGQIQDGDSVLYLLTKARLQKQSVQGVVGTVMSNKGLETALSSLGVELVRTAVGDANIAQELLNRGWSLGAESSGHILSFDKLKTGDGLLAALEVLQALQDLGVTLAQGTADLLKLPQASISVRLPAPALHGWRWQEEPQWRQLLERIEKSLGTEGRTVVRCSGTEPVVRVTVEAPHEAQAKAAAREMAEWLLSNVPQDFNAKYSLA